MAWRGGLPYQAKYPRIFSISNQQEACVRDMGGNGDWVFVLKGRFFQWEEQLFNLLKEELDGFV